MGTCRKHFRIFGCIDFKIIAFEGRRKYEVLVEKS
jgi:hypothetical protein